MSWPATVRYEMAPASGGLAFVQELLNTISAGKPRQADLLENIDDARDWLEQALTDWSEETNRPVPKIDLTEDDLQDLSDFRQDLRRQLRAKADRRAPAPDDVSTSTMTAAATLHLDENGRIWAEPRGTGWRRVASLALIEAIEAQNTDTWRRLKTCRNHRCEVAFYDRSRNNSGVWHDVRVCGNAANLRNYRARKRTASKQT